MKGCMYEVCIYIYIHLYICMCSFYLSVLHVYTYLAIYIYIHTHFLRTQTYSTGSSMGLPVLPVPTKAQIAVRTSSHQNCCFYRLGVFFGGRPCNESPTTLALNFATWFYIIRAPNLWQLLKRAPVAPWAAHPLRNALEITALNRASQRIRHQNPCSWTPGLTLEEPAQIPCPNLGSLA